LRIFLDVFGFRFLGAFVLEKAFDFPFRDSIEDI